MNSSIPAWLNWFSGNGIFLILAVVLVVVYAVNKLKK